MGQNEHGKGVVNGAKETHDRFVKLGWASQQA